MWHQKLEQSDVDILYAAGHQAYVIMPTVYLSNYSNNLVIPEEPEPEPEPEAVIECLDETTTVQVVNSGGNKYVFNTDPNNGATYSEELRYGMFNGSYVFSNISSSHPMAILNSGKTELISYTGDSAKKLTKNVDGISYDFYHGDINVQVNGDFGQISVYCYYHGYMGGNGLLIYSEICQPPEPEPEPESEPEPEPEPELGDFNFRIVRLQREGDVAEYINIHELQVWIGGVNVAISGTATALDYHTSLGEQLGGAPSYLNDGDFSYI